MRPLHETVTWYKICLAGWQATHWDIQKKEKSRLAGRNRFVLEAGAYLLPSSVVDFVPCDSIMQSAHCQLSCVLSSRRFKLSLRNM